MDIINIQLDMIDEDTDQPRYQFNEEALEELMRSIEELGLLSPIKVRTMPNGRYMIIYGNRRYKASKMLGLATIPCLVSNVTDEVEIYLEQIAENLTREGFSPIEEGEAFNKLLQDSKFNSSTKFLASKLGKTESYIKNKCELLKFGKAVRKLIVSGTFIKKDQLIEDQLLPIKDLPLEHRDPLALIIARDELPVSDVKKIAKLFKDPDMSAATKDKLLYKSGHELLETWYTHEQNKKYRAKLAEEQAAQAEAKRQAAEAATAAAAAREETAAAAQEEVVKATPIELKLKKLMNSVPVHIPLTEVQLESQLKLAPEQQASMLHNIESFLETLSRHMQEWKAVEDQLKSSMQRYEAQGETPDDVH